MLLVVLSKGGRCYFWSLFDCDDRRSPWWASCVGTQHDADMISISFNSYASLAVFGTTDCVTTDKQSYLKKFEEISYVVRLYFSPLLYSARHLFLDFFLWAFVSIFVLEDQNDKIKSDSDLSKKVSLFIHFRIKSSDIKTWHFGDDMSPSWIGFVSRLLRY